MIRSNKSTGFTLVELVIVIVLLGLLAATALPRFLDVTDQAQTASVEGVAGGFTTGVALVKARWMADGNSNGIAGAVVILDGTNILANENGWPAQTSNPGDGDAGFSAQLLDECLEVWNFVFQSPPQAMTGAVAAIASADKYRVTQQDNGGSNTCTYTLIVNDGLDPQNRNFVYTLETGQVSVNLPP